MKKLLFLFGVAALLAATLPLAAQGGHVYVHPPVSVIPGSENQAGPTGILPVQFKAAYGFNKIPNLGAGQTIALVDAFDNPNIASDLQAYKTQFSLTPCNFQKVKVGNPVGNTGWGLEIALDVEQACALVPQAKIILVEANSNSDTDLLAAVAVASQAPYNATAISMSWGGSEDSSQIGYNSYFCNVVNGNGQPVTFFASSGDGGHGAGWPASSPCVIAVGGTNLTLAQAAPLANPLSLNYGAENAWNGSGGGISSIQTQMSWQNPACSQWSTTNRCIPDVASVSNNIPVYDTYGYPGWVRVAGTSISSPDWAAFITLANSIRASQSKGTLSQAAYDMYQVLYGADFMNEFHDITTGTNGGCGSQCTAQSGYDLVTGAGTFKANVLVNSLVAAPN